MKTVEHLYADVFALILLDNTDIQREATLLERGNTQADVDEIRTVIGIEGVATTQQLHRVGNTAQPAHLLAG